MRGHGCQTGILIPKTNGTKVSERPAPLTNTAAGDSQADIESRVAAEFFNRAIREQLDPRDVLRVTVTSFMDAYNFDVRQLMKSCVHHILPSGHIIPFSAYNVLYRDGTRVAPTVGRLCLRRPCRQCGTSFPVGRSSVLVAGVRSTTVVQSQRDGNAGSCRYEM